MATAYAINKAQQRNRLIVNPGEEIYAGQVMSFNSRAKNMTMNLTKNTKLTNMRAASADTQIVITSAWQPFLEELLTLIAPNEMLEVTPENLRLRKK